jgi:chemotaxis family two-component system response regulator Rcp1
MKILMVDDNPADIDLVNEGLRRCGAKVELCAIHDGIEAVELLRGLETASLVRLILLDVNLPKVNGQAVLRQIKNDPILRRVPVVMFSTSRAARDIRGSYESGANSYVVKPGGLKDFLSAVRSLYSYWLECAILPAGSEHG